jgi:cytochrome c-type biogenesis protein CcmH/NrfF
MRYWKHIAVTPFLLLLAVGPAEAQEASSVLEPIQAHPEGDQAIKRLRSPYCPGLMLEVCPTTTAKMLRDSIQTLAHEGTPADSIVAWMLANHGEEYLAVPRTWGSGLFAWLVPPLALLAGLTFVFLALRHFKSGGRVDPSSPQQKPLSAEDESVLAEALEELKAAEEVPF